MSRYIDADVLKDDLIYNRCFFPSIVESAIRNTPTADVVEVVRCKDCKHKITANFNGEILIGCDHTGAMTDVCNDGYCSYGERREK